MPRPEDSLLSELGRLMTAHPVTVSLMLRNSASCSPDAAAENPRRLLSDSARIAQFVTLIRMWTGLAQP